MTWPVFFKDAIKIGNLESNVAICTLWTENKKIISNIENGTWAICANLYTTRGINPMIRNIIANPKIRYIILCGKDVTGSGKSLVDFFNGESVSGIEEKYQKSVRENVKLINMIGREDKISEEITKLEKLEPFSDPEIIEEIVTIHPSFCEDSSCFTVNGNSISEAWLRILDTVMKFGEDKKSEYGINQKEILNLTAVISGDDEKIAPWMKFTDKDLEKYYPTVLSGEKENQYSYTYGERLFRHPLRYAEKKWDIEMNNTVNQIQNIINLLKKSPHTRRAAAFTWNVQLDSLSENPPCLTQLVWNIKHGKLYQTAIIRSNDMFAAWPMNAFALRELQKQIAEKLNVEIGSLVVISNSAHIYQNNWNEAKEILEKHYTGRSIPFEEDKLGYFVISVDSNEIIVQHFSKSGKTDFVFRGNNAIDIYRKIIHENLISKIDHSAYIGKELQRAEDCLKNGTVYVQDKA